MKKLFVCLLFFSAFFLSMGANAQTKPAEVATNEVAVLLKSLKGTWKWTETRRASRGTKPVTQTPESTSRQLTATFKADNTVDVYVNKKLAGTYSYFVTQRPGDYVLIEFSAVNEENQPYQYLESGPVTITNDQLYIAGGYNDAGGNQTFTKIKENKPVKKTTAPKNKKTLKSSSPVKKQTK